MKILLLQLAKMGDLLQTAPLLARLRQAYPTAKLHLLHSAMFTAVARHLDVDETHALNLDSLAGEHALQAAILPLKQQRYDLVLNPSSNRLAGQIASGLGAPVLGYAGEDEHALAWLYFALSFVHSRRLNTLNLADIYAQLLPQAQPARPGKWLPNWQGCGLVGMQLASRNTTRQWPPEQFARMASRLLESGVRVRLLGTAAEAMLAQEMLRHLHQPKQVENLVGRTDVDGLFTAVGECDVLLTADTGTMHVAAALSVPVASVFLGPAWPWDTLACSPHAAVWWPAGPSCYPCRETEPCPHNLACHVRIAAEDVWHLRAGDGARMASTARDALGQTLAPAGGYTHDECVGLLYRAWACRHFLGQASDAPALPESVRNELQRELVLWDRLRLQHLPVEKLSPNFLWLRPLVWYHHLCRNLPDDPSPALLQYIRAAL